jgi:hypothetical protein
VEEADEVEWEDMKVADRQCGWNGAAWNTALENQDVLEFLAEGSME